MVYDMCRESMQKSIDHMIAELTKVRAGKANTSMISGIMVDYYGSETPINQVANLNTPDARTITIQPWEKSMLDPIEKAIYAANIGLTPQNNGETVILNIPVLTEERRRDLVKQVNQIAEDARIGLRSSRKSANDEIKALGNDGLSEDNVRDAEGEVQNITNSYGDKIAEYVKTKEEEIMTI